MNADAVSYATGGIVFSSHALDRLTADQRRIVLEAGARALPAVSARVRRADAQSYARFAQRRTVVTPSLDERAAWSALYAEARTRAERDLGAAWVQRVAALGAN